jgi:hypothetical protein
VRASRLLCVMVLAATASMSAQAGGPPALVKFKGTIGVDPLTAAGGVDTLNVVRGINPGGRAWMLGSLRAEIGTDGSISAKGKALLFTSGDLIGTRGGVTAVAATLACGPANNTATLFHSRPADLDLAGNFRLSGKLTQDGINDAVLPATCDNPVLLIRSFNTATGALGNWFAAGIPQVGNDDD